MLYGAFGFYTLPLAGYEGGITRVGKLPESLFGWTRPQPAINPALLQQATWQEADVVVIGDSFSAGRVWQTELIAHGLKVRTLPWRWPVCEDIASWLSAQGFRGKYVVIESVERVAKASLTQWVECKKTLLSEKDQGNALPPPLVFDREKKDYSGQMQAGFDTWRNMREYERLAAQPNFKSKSYNKVKIVRMPDGCRLFSHKNCRDVPFLTADAGAKELDDEVIRSMEILNARLQGFSPLWVIVPDKSTAYLYPDKKFWQKAGERVPSVNLLEPVRQAIHEGVVDLYFANDTHFSTTGYLLMGREIYRNLDPAGAVSAQH